jgi:hypothetical protein
MKSLGSVLNRNATKLEYSVTPGIGLLVALLPVYADIYPSEMSHCCLWNLVEC